MSLDRVYDLEVPYVFGFDVPRDSMLALQVGDRLISVQVWYESGVAVEVDIHCGCGIEMDRKGVWVC